MGLINFSSSVCNYTTKVVELAAVPGSLATNTYPYVDLEMIPDSGYSLNATNFTYVPNTYVDYVVFMADGNNLKARVYLNGFTWPSERTDLEVPISGCATKIIPVVPTPAPSPVPTPVPTPTPPACPAVTGYFINKSIIELRGETRIFKVYGQQGAEFTYTVVDNGNGISLDTGTETIPYSGFVNIEIVVPLVSAARVLDVTITTAESCTLQLQTQPATFKLYQGIDEEWLGDTYECCEAAGVLQSTNCVGYDLYGTYTDGQCGTTNSLIETNSTTCGYVPPVAPVAPSPVPSPTPSPVAPVAPSPAPAPAAPVPVPAPTVTPVAPVPSPVAPNPAPVAPVPAPTAPSPAPVAPLGTQLVRCDNNTNNWYTPTTNISSGSIFYSGGQVCYRSLGNVYDLTGLTNIGSGTAYFPGDPNIPSSCNIC